MPRKGSKAAERAAEAADGSDADEATQESLQPSSPWEKAWDSTMESSAATRVKGVKTLSTLLQSGYNYDEAIRMEERFVDFAVSVLKTRRPDKAMLVATCHLISVLFITLASQAQDAYDALLPLLKEQAREGKARAACAVAIACGAVATGGTDHDRLAALRSLAGLWLVSKGADLEAALRAWAMVLTVVDVRTLSTPLIDTTLEHLASFLSGTNVAVRSAAAEALGLLYAQCGLQQLPDNDDDLLDESDLDTSSAAVASNAGSLDCSSCGVSEDARTSLQIGFDGIITQIEALSKNRGDASRRSKGDRRTSRRAAVATLSAMSTGGAAATPQVVRCSGGQRVEIVTLAQRVVYREVAAVLQSGMNAHLQHNTVIGELLGLDMDSMHCGSGGKAGKSWGEGKKSRASSKMRHKQSVERMASHLMGDCCT